MLSLLTSAIAASSNPSSPSSPPRIHKSNWLSRRVLVNTPSLSDTTLTAGRNPFVYATCRHTRSSRKSNCCETRAERSCGGRIRQSRPQTRVCVEYGHLITAKVLLYRESRGPCIRGPHVLYCHQARHFPLYLALEPGSIPSRRDIRFKQLEMNQTNELHKARQSWQLSAHEMHRAN